MLENSLHSTENTPDIPPPIQQKPLNIATISFLPPHLSDPPLAQPYSASSSPLREVQIEAELHEELEGQDRMADKVKEAEMKKASKARNREGEKGQWWSCNLTDFELKSLEDEGFIAPNSYRFTKDSSTLVPKVKKCVFTKA
jgi:hypothetical protein